MNWSRRLSKPTALEGARFDARILQRAGKPLVVGADGDAARLVLAARAGVDGSRITMGPDASARPPQPGTARKLDLIRETLPRAETGLHRPEPRNRNPTRIVGSQPAQGFLFDVAGPFGRFRNGFGALEGSLPASLHSPPADGHEALVLPW